MASFYLYADEKFTILRLIDKAREGQCPSQVGWESSIQSGKQGLVVQMSAHYTWSQNV